MHSAVWRVHFSSVYVIICFMRKKVSIVVPIYNEGSGIRNFLDRQLKPQILKIKKNYDVELLVVDDGSEDNTVDMVRASDCFKKRTKVTPKLVAFSRNFGKEMALTAGIKYATGNAVILVDGDGEHPVELIPTMIEKWKAGAKIVTAIRTQERIHYRLSSKIFHLIMRTLGNKTTEGATDFRLIDKEVADRFRELTEHNRITRGLIDWLGYPQEYIKVKASGRGSSRGSYGKKKLRQLAINSIVSMSAKPLILLGKLGGVIMLLSFLLGLFIVVQQYIMGDPMQLHWSGAVMMCVFIAFLVGVVLVSQAISSLYISQIHAEAQNRPLFLVDKTKSYGIKKK